MFVHKKCDMFLSETRCSNEWVHFHEVKISNDYELSYFQMTNSKEDEIHMNLRDLIDKVKLSIISLQNDHYNGIISRKNYDRMLLLGLESNPLIHGNQNRTRVLFVLCKNFQMKIHSFNAGYANHGCIQIS